MRLPRAIPTGYQKPFESACLPGDACDASLLQKTFYRFQIASYRWR